MKKEQYWKYAFSVYSEKERLRQKAEGEPKGAEQLRLEAARRELWNTVWEAFNEPVD